MRLAADSISIVVKEWKPMDHYDYVTFHVRSAPYKRITDSSISNCNTVYFHLTEFIDLRKE